MSGYRGGSYRKDPMSGKYEPDYSKSNGQYYKNYQQTQMSTQKQVVDQNYANNIVFMAMSTLESLAQRSGNFREPKQFGGYDKYDFSDKGTVELKKQMKIHLTILLGSRSSFKSEYGTNSYKLPKEYNEPKISQQLESYHKIFSQKGDSDCVKFTEDFENILRGKTTGLYFQSMHFEQQSPMEKKKYQGQIVSSGMRATQMMEEERQQVLRMGKDTKVEDLRFKNNPAFKNTRLW